MKLHAFIRENMPEILQEWDAFAHTLLPESNQISNLALRDHAAELLDAIAHDLDAHQSPQQQIEKSQGLSDAENVHKDAASTHGRLRQESNFSLTQLAAEFRALRASVLRLWLPRVRSLSSESVDSMIRFNEAIDQALAESIVAFSKSADQTRELFIGILGHDLRAPLATMMMAGVVLSRPDLERQKVQGIGARVMRSAKQMDSMVQDLLGYTRIQLGVGMPMILSAADLLDICKSAMDDAGALHPDARFRLEVSGSLKGSFDSVRVTQLLTNLLKNAAQYGTVGSEILITAVGDATDVTLQVNNHGATIPADSLDEVFQPLVRLSADDDLNSQPRTSLGLGLYVAKQTTIAHHGTITVESSDEAGTTFKVILSKSSESL